MRYRTLGRTGLQVSEVSLGTEYLVPQPREIVVPVLNEAIDRGINYFDVIFSMPDYLDNMGVVFSQRRDEVLLTAHLGSGVKDGQYSKTRSMRRTKQIFSDTLARLGTDHVDILFLHNCDSEKDFQTICKPGGQKDMALELLEKGVARHIGFSGHSAPTAKKALDLGFVEVLMFPVNMSGHAAEGRREMLQACAARNVAVVAMKPFAGGKLLRQERTVEVATYQAGGEAVKLTKRETITPVQCLSYALSQPGVVTAVPGCSTVSELVTALAYLDASDEDLDYGSVLSGFEQYREGECTYCNHCLPCPSEIDIGLVLRLYDEAREGAMDSAQARYDALEAKAGDCIACGACEERCPFGVETVAQIEGAAELFGS